jgi:hypothetical protein
VNLQSIRDSFKEATTKFNAVAKLEELLPSIEEAAKENEETDGTREFLAEITQESRKEIGNIEKKLSLIEEKYKELAAYFAENLKDLSMETFFDIFMKFNKDLVVSTLVM